MCEGFLEWCYQCGAIREMKRADFVNTVRPASTWVRPVGKDGENPYEKLRKL